MPTPSTNGDHAPAARDGRGRFAKGNAGGPGNPLAKRVNRYRTAVLKAGTPEQAVEIMQELHRIATGGDASTSPRDRVAAGMAWLQYMVGPPEKFHEAAGKNGGDTPQLVFVFQDNVTEARRIVENVRRSQD